VIREGFYLTPNNSSCTFNCEGFNQHYEKNTNNLYSKKAKCEDGTHLNGGVWR
jgi:hypothetical protein